MNVVAGDFNAWAVEWGSIHTNRRGETLLKAFSVLDTVLLNTGKRNTFENNGRGSVIDISFASSSLVRSCTWQVSDLYTHSDHLAILLEIDKTHKSNYLKKVQNRGWKTETLDEDIYKLMLDDNTNNALDIEKKAECLVKYVSKACDAAMCRKKQGTYRKPAYCWNEGIEALRSECHKARRQCQKGRQTADFTMLNERFKRKRNELKKAIKKSKACCFKELCNKVEENPWGDAYKIVMSKIKDYKGQAPTCPSLLKTVVQTLFPTQLLQRQQIKESGATNAPLVSDQETIEAAERFANSKASGLDGIPNNMVFEDTGQQ
ncbi:uncharacterized protein LOC125779399 [Bactrocera dorsalis]|uniref:Uncharacterized protein LOC125779399 n=1 Tax=Bactrocera dorsalis TaxID=27457 RepID=A0ABM3K5F3_BACDO|nr:uncharacterized protein LOC125779399 [Bactrocera dorsalis]